ncbi:MAG: hypothetical protein AB7P22_08435 [Vicinamibacterales bacterium]
MISFRVSESEFELLKAKSEAAGSRNVSDFARLTLCGPEGWQRAGGEVEQLRRELQELAGAVRQMTEMLEEGTPSAAAARSELTPAGRKGRP